MGMRKGNSCTHVLLSEGPPTAIDRYQGVWYRFIGAQEIAFLFLEVEVHF